MRTKRCSLCKQTKSLSEFKPDKRITSGFSGWCLECVRARDRVYSRRYREKHPEWKKQDNKNHASLIAAGVKDWQTKNPEKFKAQQLVQTAVRKGMLTRKPCKVCKSEKVHGHHSDYSKPLQVIWLCAKHHKAVHFGLIRGTPLIAA